MSYVSLWGTVQKPLERGSYWRIQVGGLDLIDWSPVQVLAQALCLLIGHWNMDKSFCKPITMKRSCPHHSQQDLLCHENMNWRNPSPNFFSQASCPISKKTRLECTGCKQSASLLFFVCLFLFPDCEYNVLGVSTEFWKALGTSSYPAK